MRASIKRRAEETDETAQQILGHELQVISQQAAVQMASIPTIRRAIRSAKQEKNAVYPLPTSRNFTIPDEYKTLPNGEDFLLHDSENADSNRILIFGTNRTVQLLIEYRHWFVDGTFKIVPELFFQLYSLHALVLGDVIPCLYALLPNKTEATYNRFLQEISAFSPDLQPESITMDYEKGAMNAVSATFPTASIHGCFYHLAQSVNRQIQELGLQERYRTDDELALTSRMLPSLSTE